MKAHRKGKGISISGGTSVINSYKMLLTDALGKPLPVLKFEPLRSWPALPHPQQSALEAYRAYPSLYS